jgi:hypothetical protein
MRQNFGENQRGKSAGFDYQHERNDFSQIAKDQDRDTTTEYAE